MPQSLSAVLVHLIFSTKNRQPFITPQIENQLHAYLTTVSQKCGCPVLTVNGTQDHVHLLVNLSRSTRLCDLVEEVKKRSSKWIKTKGPELADFHWQTGYGAFSIGQSNVAALRRYIADQKKHHLKRTFQDEYRGFLKRYQITFDEKYVWD